MRKKNRPHDTWAASQPTSEYHLLVGSSPVRHETACGLVFPRYIPKAHERGLEVVATRGYWPRQWSCGECISVLRENTTRYHRGTSEAERGIVAALGLDS